MSALRRIMGRRGFTKGNSDYQPNFDLEATERAITVPIQAATTKAAAAVFLVAVADGASVSGLL